MWEEVLLLATLALFLITILLYRRESAKSAELREKVKELESGKQSLATKYGKMTEQFMPFLEAYPYNENNFRFIGTPIDGVQFEDDRIVLLEFKTGDSKLTERQKSIEQLVKKGNVSFEVIRIK